MAVDVQKITIQPVAWSLEAVKHLGDTLTLAELKNLAALVVSGDYGLLGVFKDACHVGSISWRIDNLWDGSRWLAACHMGGKVVEHLPVIAEYLKVKSEKMGLAGVQVYCGRYELAHYLIDKQGCKLAETIVRWEVPDNV